jgi:hypothetical protein
MQARAFAMLFPGEISGSELDHFFLRALELYREVLALDDPRTLRLIYGLGHGYAFNWEDAKVVPLIEDALERALDVQFVKL